MKRLFDAIVSLAGLILTSPILGLFLVIIFLQDFKNPFYVAPRVGKERKLFKMIKLRSMVVNADKSGVDSTSVNDTRITSVGKLVRKYKLDEICQLWNVLIGDMSLVGPRPNVERGGVSLYTQEELKLLTVSPGITDISSIVFSDEGDILKDSPDPDLDYNRLIRPWKSRLGLLYIEKRSLLLDIRLIILTALTIVSRKKALAEIQKILISLGADAQLIDVCKRENPLYPFSPP